MALPVSPEIPNTASPRPTGSPLPPLVVKNPPGPVEEARNEASRGQAGNVMKPPADIEDRTIPGGPKGEISIRIVRPKDSTELLATVMYFHGGGWVLNDKESFDRLLREIANGVGAAV